MDGALGESDSAALRVAFDHRLKLEFHGSRVTSDAGLLPFRELDDALGLTDMAGEVLTDTRTGQNSRHTLIAQLRQAVFGRLAGYEDVNDADRLAHDPALRWIMGGRAVMQTAASTSQMGRFAALEPIRQGVRRHFGGFAQGIAPRLSVRHDHGSQYMSDAFQQELAFLGIASSPAFVRAPEGNGCAERFIRTLKENLLWVRPFDTVEELRQALLVFRETYNTTWLIERHGFQTPAAVRKNQLSPAVMAA